jgi:acyl-CoA synthetase (AMP-forming)/AMP-acid ligase II
MNLAEALTISAQKHLSKPAIFYGEQQFTYARLLEQTQSVAAHLRDSFGVRPGDRVALWLKNSPEFVPALFGALSAGGVVVPINNFLKANEVRMMLRSTS